MKQFTGSAQGWLQKQPPQPDPEAFDGYGYPPPPGLEPVHGWAKRQLEDYLGLIRPMRILFDGGPGF
jgi:hypothetical protein